MVHAICSEFNWYVCLVFVNNPSIVEVLLEDSQKYRKGVVDKLYFDAFYVTFTNGEQTKYTAFRFCL